MNYQTIDAKITELFNAEKVTKAVLAELSRELLLYLIDGDDVRPINRLLNVDNALTPVNWRIACQYFKHFLPFKSNYSEVKECIEKGGKRESLVFTKLDKKKYDEKVKLIAEFLEDESNNIWSWSSENVEVKAKTPDYFKAVTNAVNNAVKKGDLSVNDILKAIQESEINLDDMLLAAMQANEEEVETNF